MLTLEIVEQTGEIFCHYKPPGNHPNVGGYLGRVYPGGNFKGVSYEKLAILGSGTHMVMLNERAESESGVAPDLQDNYGWTKFVYGAGAITEHERKMRLIEQLKLQVMAENPCGILGVRVDENGKPLKTAQMGGYICKE